MFNPNILSLTSNSTTTTMPSLALSDPTTQITPPLDSGGGGGGMMDLPLMNINDTTYIYIDNPEDMIDPWRSNADFLTIVLTHAITFIIGVIGNSVVIATWARGGKIRSPTATFLISLACADLLLLIIFMPLETLEYFVITWDNNGNICKLSSFVELLSGMSSILNLVAVSVERFLVIVYPIQARRWCTVTKSRRSLVFVWILAIIFAAPPVFNKSTYSMTYYNNETSITAYYCFEKSDSWAIGFAIYELMTLFVIPALLMIFCYFRVIRELWTSTRVITILTSSSAGQYHQTNSTASTSNTFNANNTNNTNPKNDSRSYMVRWPKKKLVSISVNCEQATPPQIKSERSSRGGHEPGARNSVSSSGVSSSSTSKNQVKGATPPPSDANHINNTNNNQDDEPPDSPIAIPGALGSGVNPNGNSTTKLCKLFYCLNNLRTLLWLRPFCCTKSGCRKRGGKCSKIGHRGHHRCHHHHHWSHRSSGHTHPHPHHQHHHYHSSYHRNGTSLNAMSYQQMKACCLYKGHCNLCAQGADSSGPTPTGPGGVVIESDKGSSVSCSSVTCATSTSNATQVNGGLTSPNSPKHYHPRSSLLSNRLCLHMFQLCFCCCYRGGGRGYPPGTHPTMNGGRSPYELRNSSSYYTTNTNRTSNTANPYPSSRSTRPSYTMTSSFTNLNTNHHSVSAYNMLSTNLGVTGSGTGGTMPHGGSNTLNGSASSAVKLNLSVNSVAHQQVTTVTLPTPSTSSLPSVYHHSTNTGYRAPVTDVRNARKQLYCQVIKMLLFIVILFHICWGPRLIFNVIKSAGIGYFNNIAYSARVYFYLLSFIHSALNPFVYGFMSSNFRRMMLNSCNHHHHHHRHHHHHHRHNNSTCGPGLGATQHTNSLMEAMQATSCLNMAHLKASLSNNSNSIRRSITSDNYEPEHSSDSYTRSKANKNNSKQHQSLASVHSEKEYHSSSKEYHSSSKESSNPNGSKENSKENPTNSIESDGETSYGEIETEIQQAVDSMQNSRGHFGHFGLTSNGEPESSSKSKFLEQFIARTKKLDRSSSLFFTFKNGNGIKKNPSDASSNNKLTKVSKVKWSTKFGVNRKQSQSSNGTWGTMSRNVLNTNPNGSFYDLEHSF